MPFEKDYEKKPKKKKDHGDYEETEQEYEEEYGKKQKKKKGYKQTHVHEYTGSVMVAEEEEDCHNHRFAGVSGEAIPYKNSHIHELFTYTDFYEEHFHEIGKKTGPAIYVSKDRHVHFAEGKTTFNGGHAHRFVVATLIEDPTGD